MLGVPGFDGEVVHLVVEQEAQARHGDAVAEAAVERVGDGDGVARRDPRPSSASFRTFSVPAGSSGLYL